MEKLRLESFGQKIIVDLGIDNGEIRWMQNYEEVKKFWEEKGKYPTSTSKNKEEKSLGTWLSN